MKTKTLLMVLAITVLIGFTATFHIHSFYTYYEVREINMVLEVAQKLGFNTETDKLNFGANFPGNSCRKFMNISFPKKSIVVIEFEGQLAGWVKIDDNNFVLEPNESRHLTFTADIPKNARDGIYTGSVKFYFKRI